MRNKRRIRNIEKAIVPVGTKKLIYIDNPIAFTMYEEILFDPPDNVKIVISDFMLDFFESCVHDKQFLADWFEVMNVKRKKKNIS